MITFKFLKVTWVVYVSHTVNVFVTDIFLNNTSREYLIFALLQISSRLFELFNKEVRGKKQPGMPLIVVIFKCTQKVWRWHLIRNSITIETVYTGRFIIAVFLFTIFMKNGTNTKKILLLRWIYSLKKSDLIYNMDHMIILGFEPSSVILSQTTSKRLKCDAYIMSQQVEARMHGAIINTHYFNQKNKYNKIYCYHLKPDFGKRVFDVLICTGNC